MPLYSKDEFAKLLGLRKKDIVPYTNSGRLVARPDGMYDSDAEPNKTTMAKRLLKQKATPVEKKAASKEAKARHKKQQAPTAEETEDKKFEEDVDLYTKKLKLDIAKREQEVLEKELKNQQTMGKVIPTELVRNIFVVHNQSIVTEFKNAADRLVRAIAKKKDMNEEERAEITGALTQCVNDAIIAAVEMSMKLVDNLVMDYAAVQQANG